MSRAGGAVPRHCPQISSHDLVTSSAEQIRKQKQRPEKRIRTPQMTQLKALSILALAAASQYDKTTDQWLSFVAKFVPEI